MSFNLGILILCLGIHAFASSEEHKEADSHQEHHEEQAAKEEKKGVKTIVVSALPDDIKIPAKLWDLIEEKDSQEGHGDAHKVEHKEEHKTEHKSDGHGGGDGHGGDSHGGGEDPKSGIKTIVFAPVKVILKEKNYGVLNEREYIIELPRGGGEIDLSKYVSGKSGSFYVSFETPELVDEMTMKSWYVSRSKKRKIDNEVIGSGCNKFFDITQKLSAAMKSEGIKVNTTRDRHITLLGGHYVFAVKKDHQTLLTQVTFKDSSRRDLFCEEK